LQALPPAATGAGAATGVALKDAATAATVGAGAVGADPPDSSKPVALMFIAFIARSARPDSNSVTVAAYKLISVPSFNL
jgi:hypothetical protein